MKMKLWLVACYFATVTVAMGTQLDAPAPKDCSNIVMEMVPCLSFMTDAKTTKPTQACCQGLEKVIDFDKTCVCFALNFAPSMGIAVNISKAEVLASLCKVNDAPPVSSCHRKFIFYSIYFKYKKFKFIFWSFFFLLEMTIKEI